MSSMARIPTERARPVDQGGAGICSLVAVANAIVDRAMDGGKDFKLDEVIGALKQLDFVDEKDGNFVHEFDSATLKRITDSKTGVPYDVRITIRSIFSEAPRQIRDMKKKCVLVYNDHGGGRHSVFIERVIEIRGIKNYVCINSWGSFCPNPNIEVDREGNQIFEVKAKFTRLDCDDANRPENTIVTIESEDDTENETCQNKKEILNPRPCWAFLAYMGNFLSAPY